MSRYIIFIFLALVTFACASKDNKPNADTASAKPAIDGAKIFKQNCELCHGADGKLGANGSKDLTVSELDLNERIAMVTKGKGVMMAFENILSLSEIKAVAEYSITLKK
ncbi:MAG: cytochrome c [Saprospiraceae bacterium]|nr:cytochrome c [Saprospiraceae bacterium]